MRVEVFADDKWASVVAERWISRVADRPDSRICLPTGETPRPVYELAAPVVNLTEATVFLLDEFGLPSGNAARCDSMLQRDLLRSLARPPKAFHRLDVDTTDAVVECARFDALVADGGLDLTLLGLGGNGHLGLNEPGATPDSRTRAVTLAAATTEAASRYEVGARPVGGLTLGLHRILSSDAIWLLVSGSHKADVLAQTVMGPVTSNLPASFLRNHADVTVFADQAAATNL